MKSNYFFFLWISFTVILVSINFSTVFNSDANFNYKITQTTITIVMILFWTWVLREFRREQKALQSLDKGVKQ